MSRCPWRALERAGGTFKSRDSRALAALQNQLTELMRGNKRTDGQEREHEFTTTRNCSPGFPVVGSIAGSLEMGQTLSVSANSKRKVGVGTAETEPQWTGSVTLGMPQLSGVGLSSGKWLILKTSGNLHWSIVAIVWSAVARTAGALGAAYTSASLRCGYQRMHGTIHGRRFTPVRQFTDPMQPDAVRKFA